MGIIDLIALLASIANDASQTSSQTNDREKLDIAVAIHTMQANCSQVQEQIYFVQAVVRVGWRVCSDGWMPQLYVVKSSPDL